MLSLIFFTQILGQENLLIANGSEHMATTTEHGQNEETSWAAGSEMPADFNGYRIDNEQCKTRS